MIAIHFSTCAKASLSAESLRVDLAFGRAEKVSDMSHSPMGIPSMAILADKINQ
jgi:hypothetical protein